MTWKVLRGGRRPWVGSLTVALSLTSVAAGLAEQDDRAAALATTNELERVANHKSVAAEAIARAKNALDRASQLRAVGDPVHARLAEGLGRQWAETGRDLGRAADAEAQALDLRRKAQDNQAQIIKTRALVEEVIARTGRLRAEIDAIERDGGAPRTAVELHDREGASKRPTGSSSPPAPGRGGSDGGPP